MWLCDPTRCETVEQSRCSVQSPTLVRPSVLEQWDCRHHRDNLCFPLFAIAIRINQVDIAVLSIE